MSTDFRGLDPKGLPLVSIVAGCYNHEQYLEETLDSIKAQTYPNIQLIIMDDYSQDESVQLIEKWVENNKVNCKCIFHTENKGICYTLNEALKYAEGKYFQGISCDDIMLKQKIETQVTLLEKSKKDVAMVFSDAYYIDEEGNLLFGSYIQHHKQFLQIPSGNIFEELIKVNFIPAMSVLVKKEVFEKVGFYDEDLDYEDTDMWIRIAKKYNILFSDIVSVKYRLHDKNLTTTLNFEFNRFKYLIKHFNDSSSVRTELENTILLSYKRNNPQIDYMRKEYYKLTREHKFLNASIKYKLPFKLYYLFTKLFKELKK